MQTARALLKDAKALRAQKDFRGALEKFKAVYGLVPTPVTGSELATAYLDVGLLVEAREAAVTVVQMPKASDETEVSDRARADCTKLAAELVARIPSLTVRVTGAASGAAKVTLDGAAIPSAALGIARKVDPGHHVVVATAAGAKETRGEVDLAEGQSRELTLTLETSADAPPVGAAGTTASTVSTTTTATTGAPGTDDSTATTRGTSTLTYVGFGVAGAGLVVGSVAGLLAFSKLPAAKDGCVDNRCPPSAQSSLDASKSWGTISTIGFVVAGAGAAVGVISLLSGHPEPRSVAGSPRAALWFGVGSAGVSGAF